MAGLVEHMGCNWLNCDSPDKVKRCLGVPMLHHN